MLPSTDSENKNHTACERDDMRSRMRQSRTSGSSGSGVEQSRRLPNTIQTCFLSEKKFPLVVTSEDKDFNVQ